jgi:hypothetical protein
MPYILAFCDEPVPSIPQPPVAEAGSGAAWRAARTPDRREHFGTEEAALRRAVELLPAPPWRQLRLYGPDGVRIADQAALEMRLGQPRG